MDFMDIIGGVGDVLDTPGAMLRSAIMGKNPFSGVFDTSQRSSGRDVLEHYGVAGENQEGLDIGDVGGFLAEMALDPTNLVGGGLISRIMGKGAKAAKANKGIHAANELSMSQRARGFMPEEIAKLTKIVDETGVPKKMYHGTSNVFDKFDADKLDPDALYGKGVYMTQSPVVAGEYSHKGASELRRAATSADPRLADLKHRKEVVKSYNRKNRDASEFLINDADEAARLEKRWDKSWEVRDKLDEMIEARLEEVSSNAATPNVRQHYIDARNPLNIDDVVPVTGLAEKKLIKRTRDEIRANISDAKSARDKLEWYKSAPDEEIGFRSFGESVSDPERVRKIRESQVQHATVYKENAMHRLRNQLPFRNRTAHPSMMRGEDLYDMLGNEGVREAGYDAINYVGGGRTGNVPHNVTVALDPSQIYQTAIAKEIQKLMKIPNARPMLEALLGYNAARVPSQLPWGDE